MADVTDTEFLTIGEAARLMRVSKQTVGRLFALGELAGVRIGVRGVRLDKQSVAAYMTRRYSPAT